MRSPNPHRNVTFKILPAFFGPPQDKVTPSMIDDDLEPVDKIVLYNFLDILYKPSNHRKIKFDNFLEN